MINPILKKQRDIYKANFLQQGPGPKGVMQNNIQTQYLRFQRLFINFSFLNQHISIHDVGCGICDLHEYLNLNSIDHVYSGTEIVQDMIDYSLKKYPNIEIKNRDITKADKNEFYDILVLSGTLNLHADIAIESWRSYVFRVLEKMFSMCKVGISFNFLTTYKTFTDPDLCYFDPLEMVDFSLKSFSRFVNLDHSYPLYEATITVFKSNFIKSIHQQAEFDKYFNNH